MVQTIEQLGADWIAYARCPSNASEQQQADAGSMHELSFEDPELAWAVIKLVVRTYPETDFYAEKKTEAQKVCGLVAAGPIEDLLSYHGENFIARFEDEARSDRRIAWALGGVWQFEMTDEIWQRVQLAADHSYWNRNIPE